MVSSLNIIFLFILPSLRLSICVPSLFSQLLGSISIFKITVPGVLLFQNVLQKQTQNKAKILKSHGSSKYFLPLFEIGMSVTCKAPKGACTLVSIWSLLCDPGTCPVCPLLTAPPLVPTQQGCVLRILLVRWVAFPAVSRQAA